MLHVTSTDIFYGTQCPVAYEQGDLLYKGHILPKRKTLLIYFTGKLLTLTNNIMMASNKCDTLKPLGIYTVCGI